MTPEQQIEEAHGLWELAIVRLATFVEAGAIGSKVDELVRKEREAFSHWEDVSRRALKGDE